jgi:hypothetical protein
MLTWVDAYERLAPAEWLGLRLTAHGFPVLRVRACAPRCLRLDLAGTPLLWARIAPDYGAYELLRARPTEPLNVLPPTLYDAAAETTRDWARLYAQLLSMSPASPLYEGSWLLGARG